VAGATRVVGVTFLFCDMVGSTDLLSQLGDAVSDELRRDFFEALRAALVSFHGEEVKSQGDGLMATFTSVAEALACAVAMQLNRRTAPDYGGDLSRPVTAVGWSLGADFVLLGSLQGPDGEASTGRCPGQVPRPDVVVGLAGCYYEFDGKPVSWFDDIAGWGNKDAEIRLVAGDRDTTCPGWQTEKLAAVLRTAGYQPDVTRLDGANHFAPVFHDMRNGQWQVMTDNPPGDRTVQVIVDAIAAARETRSTD